MKKWIVYFLVNLSVLLVGHSAASDLMEHEVYLGVAGPIECIVADEDRAFARVEMLDTLATDQREIHLIDESGQVRQAKVANCEFEGSSYSCSWGRTMRLEISLSEVYESTVNRFKPKPFLKGWLKSDIFRPGTRVSCPLKVESRT